MIRTLAGEYAIHALHWLWQTSLVAVLALAVVRAVPRTSARFRATVMALAFWKFLLPPMLPSPTGLFSHLAVFGTLGDSLPAWNDSRLVLATILALAAVHAVGGAFRLAGVFGARQRLRRSFVGGRRAGRVRLVVTQPGDPFRVPMVFGFWNPSIVLPAAVVKGLSPSRRRILFAHERCHLERGHYLIAVVEEIGMAIGWIQPLLRLVVLEQRRLREELCDADVISRTGTHCAEYAACILEIARICGGRSAPSPALGATSSAAALRTRIESLFRRARWSVSEVVAALAMWTLLLPGIRPWPASNSAPSVPNRTEVAAR